MPTRHMDRQTGRDDDSDIPLALYELLLNGQPIKLVTMASLFSRYTAHMTK